MKKPVSIFWFRRDLRLNDNVGLKEALGGPYPVLPIFIFDTHILDELPKDDARLSFIYKNLSSIDKALKTKGSSISTFHKSPLQAFKELTEQYDVKIIYTNRDYEPYAQKRDSRIASFAKENAIDFKTFKDQVIFEKDEVVKKDGKPYTVYTPYKKVWLATFKEMPILPVQGMNLKNFCSYDATFPTLTHLGFKESKIKVPDFNLEVVKDYANTRNLPALDGTSKIGPHLRFGTVGIRTLVDRVKDFEGTYLSELIWREFFMQILYHFPKVVAHNFRAKYDGIKWRNNKEEFKKWCEGKTGYPIVDAGMRELNTTGFMHNRVRMVTASFLCKHLLIDWRWGEAYFAKKLLDYDLSANNGNWQWAAGTGCDAAPYFRVFNPQSQLERFDKQMEYVKHWVPEVDTSSYAKPMVDHKEARLRALAVYKEGIETY